MSDWPAWLKCLFIAVVTVGWWSVFLRGLVKLDLWPPGAGRRDEGE